MDALLIDDMRERGVGRVSEQRCGETLFYIIFFKKNYISFLNVFILCTFCR